MGLKDKWINKVDDVDDVMASDINDIAASAINNEEDIKKLQNHIDSLECFDGYISTIAYADDIDNRNNPRNLRIFRVGKDNGKGEGGILIVSGDTNTLYEHHPLEAVEQTYITHDGYVKTRHATNWDGYDGLVFEWSEWKSRYLTSEDVQELKAKTGYFSTSLAAGNVDYEIIAYDMTGIFGGLPVEPLSVLVSPDNTGIWESLSIVYADINGVRCKLNRSDFATNDLTANQTNGYTGDKKDWFVYWYIGSDYDFNSEELNTGKYDISMAVPKFKVDEYGNISANSLKLKYDDRAIQIVNTAEGESIAIPDSIEAPFKSLKVMGKTEQVKTNGYQLFDAENMVFINASGTEYKHMGNGVIRVTKTKAGAGLTYVSGNMFDLEKVAGKKIYVSGYVKSSSVSSTKNIIRIGVGNSITQETKSLAHGETKATGTLNKISFSCNLASDLLENYDKVRIILYENGTSSAVGNVGDYVDFSNIMISTENVEYEPYTGEKPAPNVNYPQPLESIGDDGSVDVNVHGYQLFDASRIVLGGEGSDTKTIGGVTITRNDDGSFSFSGETTPTTSGGVMYRLSRDETLKLLKLGYIHISNVPDYTNPYIYLQLTKEGASFSEKFQISSSGGTSEKNKEITEEYLNNPEYYAAIGIYIDKNKPVNIRNMKPMIHQDGDGTWEPYKPIQTLNIPTPNGLPAVPVSSDGNYTDASGQQWVCDEKDYDREVYVQRVYKYEVTGDENWKQHSELTVGGYWRYDCAIKTPSNIGQTNKIDLCMCTHYKYKAYMGSADEGVWVTNTTSGITPVVGLRIVSTLASLDELTQMLKDQHSAGTPVTFQYILAEPIETPLSEEEIAAYKALHTHYPNTSIHNSENVYMSVDYVADTKNYVDNQIKKEVAELTAAILTQ